MDELKGIHTSTPLSCAFFSNQNLSALQTKIRYQVWLESNKTHIIGNQSIDELKLIMRSIFLQNGLNQPGNILGQVQELNAMVINFCVRNILVSVTQYLEYNKHIQGDRDIIPHSINVSNRGNKQLTLKPWF